MPLGVTVMNDRDIVVDFEPEVPIIDNAQVIHGLATWKGKSVDVSCLMSEKESLLNMVQTREEVRVKNRELERDQQMLWEMRSKWWSC